MKKIIVVNELDRNYVKDKDLTNRGIQQSQAIARAIQKLLEKIEGRTFVYTSKETWAVTAGKIISKHLSVEIDNAEMVTERPNKSIPLENIRGFLAMIGESIDVVIITGLTTYSRDFCEYYAREEWHELGIVPLLPQEGDAYVLDCETRKIYSLTSINQEV